MTACNGQCVDTTSDSNNCGRCNSMCTGGMIGETCINGQCVCPNGQPPACSYVPYQYSPPINVCAGSTNTYACGACGVTCASNQICLGGNYVYLVRAESSAIASAATPARYARAPTLPLLTASLPARPARWARHSAPPPREALAPAPIPAPISSTAADATKHAAATWAIKQIWPASRASARSVREQFQGSPVTPSHFPVGRILAVLVICLRLHRLRSE